MFGFSKQTMFSVSAEEDAEGSIRKGTWTPDEDEKLLSYVKQHGPRSWTTVATHSGLQRTGKSCRMRWRNYLRPGIKRGNFSIQEDQMIVQLHALLGNRWTAIAQFLDKRTDNEIKNYWNIHLKKKLLKKGIDPSTHKPAKESTVETDCSKEKTLIDHKTQWEAVRMDAEARLACKSNHANAFSSTTQLNPDSELFSMTWFDVLMSTSPPTPSTTHLQPASSSNGAQSTIMDISNDHLHFTHSSPYDSMLFPFPPVSDEEISSLP